MLYLAESNQNQTESNQKMPHSVKSKIKMIENAHRAYLFELFEKLQDGDKISGFKKGMAVVCQECNLVYDPETYKCPHLKNIKEKVCFS